MKDAGATWKLIGLALNKNPVTVRSWYQRNKINRQLPPKEKMANKVTDGRVGLLIKSIARKDLPLPPVLPPVPLFGTFHLLSVAS